MWSKLVYLLLASSSYAILGAASPLEERVIPKDLKLRILPLGDSLTSGMAHTKGDGYRKNLYDDLTASGAKVEYVGSQSSGSFPQNKHEGWISYAIDQISAKADQPQALGANPNLVLLLAGTNDVIRSPKGAPQRLQALIEKIVNRVPGVTVLVGTIYPFSGTYLSGGKGDTVALVKEYNSAIIRIVQSMGAKGGKVALADLSAIALSDLADGLHPNDAGYAKMAKGWSRAINEAVSKGWLKDAP